MRRTFIYFAAFTGMGTLFALTMILAAIVLGAPSTEPGAALSARLPRDRSVRSRSPPSTSASSRPWPTSSAPGTYTVTFVNDGGTYHDLTFADGTVIGAEGHESATAR